MPWAETQFAAYSCEFSPFHGNFLAVGTAQYYGFVGNGKLYVFDINGPGGTAVPVCEWLTREGVYDTAWSEDNEHVLATAQSDGTVKLFDWSQPQGPIMDLPGHTAEVYGVDWNLNTKQLICSASWDHTVRVWDVMQGTCVNVLQAHKNIAYSAIWSPARPSCLASVAGDAMLHIHDLTVGEMPAQSIQAHQHEILTVDWNKYNEFQVLTGSVDKTIRVFDIRNLTGPVQVLHGHQLAVRRIKCHPHYENQVVSASYDMSVNVWDLNMGQMIQHYDHHNEFVLGVDLGLFEENLIATAAWDRTVSVWNYSQGPSPPPPPGMKQAGRAAGPMPGP
jgi:peroxin-7